MLPTEVIELIAGHSPFQNTPRPRRRLYAALTLAVVLVVVLVIGVKVGGWAAHNPVDAMDPLWTQALASKVAQARQWWVFRLCALDIGLSYLTMSILYRTPLGKVLWWWSPNQDLAESAAAKTLSAGLAFCALLIAYALLLSQVLP